jgi:hypothetical protein
MRSRAPVALLASLLAVAIVPSAANAGGSANLAPYSASVDSIDAAAMADRGIDMGESGYDSSKGGIQDVQVVLSPSQAAKLESDGIDIAPLAIDAPSLKSNALGASPNPFFNVYRSYMEPGGIADEMRATAAANPDVMKLEQIGTSTLGKPILDQDDRERAQRRRRHARPAILFSAVNHAREWIAAEMGRRPAVWFAEHKNDPEIQRLIADRELWFVPIQNPDGYDFTFTCGTGARRCRATTASARSTTTASGARRCATTTQRDLRQQPGRRRPEPQLPGQARHRRGGRRPTRSRARPTAVPYALSEPEEPRHRPACSAGRLRGQHQLPLRGQLLLTPVSYTTDYYPPDSTLFDAITGTDGDEAVFPYRSQHSSDLYESNGDTIDNAYMNYGIIGWTPEMDTCGTLASPRAATSSPRRTTSPRSRRSSTKNLAFALNVAGSIKNLGRPKNFDNDPSHYQVKPTQGHPAGPVRRLLRRHADRRGDDPQGARRRRHHGHVRRLRRHVDRSR